MNYGYMVIYKKDDGKLLYRARKTKPEYNKSDKTSMGWTIVDIQRLYNGKCYSYNDFDILLARKHKLYYTITLFNNLYLKYTLKYIIEIGIILYFIVKLAKV